MNRYVKDLEIKDFNNNRIITLNNEKTINKNKKTNKKKSNKIKNEIRTKLRKIDKKNKSKNKSKKKTLYRKIKKIYVNSKWRDALKRTVKNDQTIKYQEKVKKEKNKKLN